MLGQCYPGLYGRQASNKGRESAQILERPSENIPLMSGMPTEHQETIRSGPEVMGVTQPARPRENQKGIFLIKK